MSETLIEIKNLMICIPPNRKLLEEASLKLERGETLALMGGSGQGKTTLALTLMGLQTKKTIISGSISILGNDWRDASEVKRGKIRGKEMAMVFQDPGVSLNPFFKVGFQLREVLKAHTHMNQSEILIRMSEGLIEVGLRDVDKFLNAYPHQLSGGEKQRILIAMALLCNPKILIADEPTASLDLIVKVEILKLLQKLQQTRGLGLFLITHDPHIAYKMADDVYELKESRVLLKQSAHRHLESIV